MSRSFLGVEWAGRPFFVQRNNNNKEIPLIHNNNKSSHLFSTCNVCDMILNIFTYLGP